MLDKTFNFKKTESDLYPKWEQSGIFSADVNSDKKPYTIMMPPPNVNGSLHVGHALVMTLQDVLTRYHRMKGRDALWMPGTDHASIAVDLLVNKELEAEGLTKKEIGREEFLKRCWIQKEKSGSTITNQLRKMGTTPDWSRERFTMDDDYMKSVIHMFVKMYKDDLIYRDQRLVNWDPKLKTSVSDIEVEHRDVKGKMYHVRYPFEDGSGHISIATTRPETILADGAIAVNPDDERFKSMVGKFVVVPICNRIIPIIADEYVKSDFGSGAVKITAAHDYNDFEVYKRHKDKGIPLINLMNPDGSMNENCPKDYQGLDRFAARDKIIADLDELEYLEKIEDHVHPVPYGERSGAVIEPYLTDQWYCDAKTLGKDALAAVEDGRMEFVPKQWENTYFSWMRNLEPWCISRQLWWGYQIPAYYGPDDKIFVAETAKEAQIEANAHYGEVVELRQDEDILDTWFSSALWPFATLGWPEKTPELDKYYPGDVLVTGFDIIFFWVARMMMMGMYVMKEVPFKKVYMNGLVRDSKGHKMSKSKGNVMDPLEIIDKYGADALRFTMCAMCGQGRDIKLSEQRIEGYRNFTTKLWNAARYCEMNEIKPVDGFDPTKVENAVNQWILHETMSVIDDLDNAMSLHRFNDAANITYHFIWGTFCDWYLEFTKPLLNNSEYMDETKATTAWVFDQIIKILNPFMPYITEELYRETHQTDELLMAQEWPVIDDRLKNKRSYDEIELLQRVVSDIRSIRKDMSIPGSAKLELLVLSLDESDRNWFEDHNAVILKMARIEKLSFVPEMPKGAVQIVVGELTLGLPVADIIDLDKERDRLNKEIQKLEKDIKQIEGKLSNQNFIAKAPKEVIEEQENRKEDAKVTIVKLSAALNQIANT